jgi:hypothetical protein|tara:strand:- start:682 stop:1125 length:444 start_codon:yes stop_codon:yes gene_type:complete
MDYKIMNEVTFGTLFLIRGLPGAGKTEFVTDTTRTVDLETGHTQQIATDHYFYIDGVYEFDPAKLGENHQRCINQVKEWMEDNICYEVLVHNTFTQEREMEPYYVLAEKYNWRVYSIIVENRHAGKSEHNVPDGTLNAMKERFEVQL